MSCDDEIYKRGVCVALTAGGTADDTERWVQEASRKCGVKIDWHYVAGRGVIKTLPRPLKDLTAAINALATTSCDRLRPEFTERFAYLIKVNRHVQHCRFCDGTTYTPRVHTEEECWALFGEPTYTPPRPPFTPTRMSLEEMSALCVEEEGGGNATSFTLAWGPRIAIAAGPVLEVDSWIAEVSKLTGVDLLWRFNNNNIDILVRSCFDDKSIIEPTYAEVIRTLRAKLPPGGQIVVRAATLEERTPGKGMSMWCEGQLTK